MSIRPNTVIVIFGGLGVILAFSGNFLPATFMLTIGAWWLIGDIYNRIGDIYNRIEEASHRNDKS